MTFLAQAAAFILAPFLMLGASIGTSLAPEPTPSLGASEEIPVTIAFFETTLATAISSSATTFTLTSAVDKDGTTLASSTYAFVIDEGSSNEEIVIADCTGTACTNAERGISARTGNTEVTALKKAHRRGASVKMTDAPLLPLVARILRGEGTVEFTPSTGGNLVTKTYVDSLALGSTTVAATEVDDGIVELATEAETLNGTETGGSGASLVVQSQYAPSIVARAAPPGTITAYASSSAPTGWLSADGSAVSRTTYADLFAVVGTTWGTGDGSTTFNLPDLKSTVIVGSGQRTRAMTFDGASAVDPGTDTITVTSNDWLHTGQAVALTGSALPTGLSATTYYVIRVSSTVIKLATSRANADDDIAVDITADGSGVCTLTQTLTARTVGQTGGEEQHTLQTEELASHVHSARLAQETGTASGGGTSASPDEIANTAAAGSDAPHNIMPPYVVMQYIIKY